LLRPIEPNDYETFLHLAKQDEEMWKYFSLNLADEAQLRKWMEMAFADKKAETRRPFAIIDKQTGQIAGSSSMGNISYYDLRLEIGWSWLGKEFRSTGLNKHAKFSMMRYAFDKLNFERVEFKTDVQNERARQGLRKVGGIEEGILRSHMTMWNNRRRTSIYYSVLKDEWPGLKETIFADIES
jgi:RimJ/RimL family protein N-acetyltransferase